MTMNGRKTNNNGTVMGGGHHVHHSGSVGTTGSGHKLVDGSQNSLHSHSSSRYLDNNAHQLEEMIIRNHIASELGHDLNNGGQKTSSLTSSRPDLIGSGNIPQPTHFSDGTMIIENIDQGDSGAVLSSFTDEGLPEHYDLDNASSIAPSDSDVIKHYQRYRYGSDLKAHLHHNNHRDR